MTLFQTLYTTGPNGHWVFLLLTVILGGAAAYVSGKAIAETWRPFWQVIAYCLLMALVVRFMHFALFEEVMLSLRNYIIDAAVLLLAGVVGYNVARRRQMAETYNWLRPAA
jgi:hypothetical protein